MQATTFLAKKLVAAQFFMHLPFIIQVHHVVKMR